MAIVTGFSPAAGPAGTVIAISGAEFGTQQGASTVTIAGAPCQVTFWNDNSITVVYPGNATGIIADLVINIRQALYAGVFVGQ